MDKRRGVLRRLILGGMVSVRRQRGAWLNMDTGKVPYWGSVRFFKHIILLALSMLIVVPSLLCIIFWFQNSALRASAADLPVSVPSPAFQSHVTADLGTPADAAPSATPGLATETPAWQALYPQLYAPPAQRSTVNEEKTVYLTFDDGPSTLTPQILEVLEAYDVKATFFVVGKTDEASLQWMRDITAAGHALGMHSFSHDYKTIYSSTEAFLEDYNQIYNLIYEATGAYPTISRFPGGSINGYDGAIYRDIISELVRRGFVYFDWNVTTGDAAENGMVPVSALTKNALDRVEDLRRAVVLMHDSAPKRTTLEALPAIIEGYRDAGFTFAPLTPEVVPVVYTYPS